MNIYLKRLFFIIATILLSDCVWSSEGDVLISDTMIKLCEDAKYGKLNLNTVQNFDPLENSHLFNCAISVVISFPDEKSSSIEIRNKQKEKIAEFFISKVIDVNYEDESESTLVISVIASYMSSEWKAGIVKVLISKGSNVNKKNIYGKSAVELAKFRKESEIVKILLIHIGKT